MVAPSAIWPAEHETALRALVLAGAGSHSIMAQLLNEQFGTSYSRNALIGKVSRMGLRITETAHPVRKKQSANPERRRRNREPIARAEPVKIDLPALRCVEVTPKNVSLTDLSPDGCRWPYGEGAGITFCDHPQLGVSSYCGPHLALSLGPGTFDERRADRLPREAR